MRTSTASRKSSGKMVRFDTSRFGSLEVSEERIIHFSQGLLGFPTLTRYVLMDYQDTPVKWLQAVDDPDVAFIVMEPTQLVSDYTVTLEEGARQALKFDDEEDLAMLTIVRVEDGKVYPNLKGPLLFNARLRLGIQCVLE